MPLSTEEQQTLKTYVTQLLKLNWQKMTEINFGFLPSISLGFAEELFEFADVMKKETPVALTDVTKEAGDVFAYGVLLLASFNVGDMSKVIDAVVNDYVYAADEDDLTFDDLCLFSSASIGNLKRIFREQAEFDPLAVIAVLEIVRASVAPLTITLADICETNIRKLTDRSNRGVMFQGKGDNR